MKHYFVPMGRINDYKHPSPENTVYSIGRGFSDYKFTVFPNRAFVINACKKGGNIHALVKDSVEANMLLYPNYQQAI